MPCVRLHLLNDENGPEALLNPSCGGRIETLRLRPDASSAPVSVLKPEENGQQNGQQNGCSTERFNGHILLPFNDRIPGGRYRWNGEEYRFPPNDPDSGDAIHGLLYAMPLEVEAADCGEAAARAVLTRSICPADAPGYPFSLFVRITSCLLPGSFELNIEVRNTGRRPAPLTLGWHPYFRLPGPGGAFGSIDDLTLQLPADRYVAVNDDLLPTGETPPLAGSPYDFSRLRRIAESEMDIALRRTGNPALLAGDGYRLEITAGPVFAYWQVFTPPERDSIAVEPVSAATNAFNRPELGLQVMEPSSAVHARVQVRLSAMQ